MKLKKKSIAAYLVIGCLMDVVFTLLATSLGYVEANPVFYLLGAPLFMAIKLLFNVPLLVIYKFTNAEPWVTLQGLVLGFFAGFQLFCGLNAFWVWVLRP